MRITHVIDSIEPSRGGPPVVATRLASAQASLGHEVSILSYCAPDHREAITGFYQHIPGRSNVTLKFLEPDWNRFSYLVHDSTIADTLKGSDVLHLHGVWEPLLVEAANQARLMGIPYAVRPAGMLDPWSLKQKMLKKRLAMMLGVRRMLDRSAFVHALNRDERYLLEPLRLACPIHVIPNGVFPEEVSPLPERGLFRAKFPQVGNAPFILFLSRLHHKKGLDFLAEAFAIVARSRQDVRLVVAGPDGGALEPFKRQIERLGLADRVLIPGPLYGPDKIAAMVDANCFCLPSRQEGFSVAITEALACGTPVVISNACHFPEVDEFGAGIITPLQPFSIASALLRVLDDPNLAVAFGSAGRNMVLSRYTWPKIAQLAVDIYTGAIARLRPRDGIRLVAPERKIADAVRKISQRLSPPAKDPSPVPQPPAPSLSAKVESSPKLLGVDELCAGQWWQQFTEIARKTSPQFVEELRNLIADYLPVAPVLGQTSIGPRRADEIDNYLATHQKWILRHPKFAVHALAQTFLEPAAPDARRDVMAALAFLAVARRRVALLIISNWDEISSASYTDRGPALEAVRSPSILLDIAIISDAPSPAQFSLLERLAKELRQCHIHKIFTHRISDQNMPWNVGIPADYDPVFFPREHLRFATTVEKRSVALFRRIRRYILENQIRVIILQGSNNLTRFLLVKWARRSGIPLLIAGDYNVFCQPNLGALPATARAIYYRWLLRNVSGLMPTGTCGRAFFRQLYNHSLPEFPFPPEPDYSQFTPAPSRQRDLFLAEHSLDPARKRFLFFGRLDSNSSADLLLDAFSSFALRNADWDLLVAGDGELRRALESRVPKTLVDRVRFLGFVHPDQKAACYQSCDVLVDPGGNTRWRVEIAQAVACRLAVIATSVNAAAVELVRNRVNGLIVPPHNIRFLTEALDQIADGNIDIQMKAAAPDALRIWRGAADPLGGLLAALDHFDLLPSSYRNLANRSAARRVAPD